MFRNVNNTGFYLALVLTCLTVELWQREKQDAGFWRDLVLLGLAGAMLFYTNSRTGELAILCAWLFGGILYVWANRQNLRGILLKRILPVILSLLVLIPATVYLFIAVRPVSNRLSTAAYTAITAVMRPSQNDGQEPGTPEDDQNQEGSDGLQGFIQKTEQKGAVADKSIDAYSTGRLSIWQVFASHARLFGTEPPYNYYVEARDTYYTTAHNTQLDYAVHSGWICGLLFLLFNILAGLKSLYYAHKCALHTQLNSVQTQGDQGTLYALLPFMVTIAYGVCSVLGSLNTPYYYMISMYYFFVQVPLIVSPQRGEQGVSSIERGARI